MSSISKRSLRERLATATGALWHTTEVTIGVLFAGVKWVDDRLSDTLVYRKNKVMRERLAALSKLENGWLDGEGRAISAPGAFWLGKHLSKLKFSVAPGLFPTAEGNIMAEWSRGTWELSAEFDLSSRRASLHALNVETLAEKDLQLSLTDQPSWKEVERFINGFNSLSSEQSPAPTATLTAD